MCLASRPPARDAGQRRVMLMPGLRDVGDRGCCACGVVLYNSSHRAPIGMPIQKASTYDPSSHFFFVWSSCVGGEEEVSCPVVCMMTSTSRGPCTVPCFPNTPRQQPQPVLRGLPPRATRKRFLSVPRANAWNTPSPSSHTRKIGSRRGLSATR